MAIAGTAATNPTILRLSIVIPVYNGAAPLARCLEAVRRSEPAPFECIVVDDGSSDDSAAVAARYGATCVRLEQRGGPARARNRGAAVASGDALVFLDADVCLHPDTLDRIAQYLQAHPAAAAVMGSYDDRPTEAGLVSQYKNLQHHYVHQRSRPEAWTFWAGCGAVRRDVFAAVGGFDESYTRPCVEDIELGHRLHRSGYRMGLDATIQATHLKRWTLVDLVRTDVCDRAVPWLLLLLRDRTLPSDLNVRVADRVSVLLVWLMFGASVVAVLGARRLWPLIPVAAVLLVTLNLDFYRFLARKRGISFALRSLPLHALYYWYCGLAAAFTPLWYAGRELIASYRRGRGPAAIGDGYHD